MKTHNKNGYVSEVLLSNNTIREMRKHVEYEKFVARILIDNEITREFKETTQNHPDGIHRFLYNNEFVDKHTMRYTDPNVDIVDEDVTDGK